MNAPDRLLRSAGAGTLLPRTSVVIALKLLLCLPFIISGVSKLLGFDGAMAEVRGLAGLEPAWLFAGLVILTQLGGSALLILGGRLAWLGGAALAGFTFVATLLAHAYWTKGGIDRVRDFNAFWEHMGLIGGLGLAALLSHLLAASGPRQPLGSSGHH